MTMVERKSGFGVIVKVAHKTSELVSNAIIEGLRPFADRVKTLTYDNSKEFAAHIQIDQTLEGTGYFDRPFASWGRDSNENFNGLLHQYVPKKRSMNTVDEEEITMIQNRLKNRPRKRLGFKITFRGVPSIFKARCAYNLNPSFHSHQPYPKISS